MTTTHNAMLTTFDNPYDPFTQFPLWFLFDMQKGYNSCAYLGRIAKTSDQFSQEENEREVELAIDEIIKNDAFNLYHKVYKSDEAKAAD